MSHPPPAATAPSGAAARPRPPGGTLTFAGASARVAEVSLGQMLWSRRTIFMGIVLVVPMIVALSLRLVDVYGETPLKMRGEPLLGVDLFGLLLWWIYLRFVIPVLGAFYGTGLIADEVEDKTLTYLFTRPVPRAAVLLGKYCAYLACTSLLVLPSVLIVFFLLVPLADVGRLFTTLITDLGLLTLGLAVYGAVFAFAGTVLRRPLIAGLVFAFGWEQVAMVMPGYLRRVTVVYYLQGLAPHVIPSDGVVSLLASTFRDTPTVTTCLFWLAVALIVPLTLAARAVGRREYVLSQ